LDFILAIYAFGLFVSGKKDERQLQIFGGLAALSAVVRAFFDIESYSTAGAKVAAPSAAGTPRGSAAAGSGLIFTGVDQITIVNGVQLIMGAALLYLSYNMWKK
jgi:hypothetical protein